MFVVLPLPIINEFTLRVVQVASALPTVRLGVITHEPLERMPLAIQQKAAAHWRVDNLLDEGQLYWAVESLSGRHGPIDRLFSPNEQIQVPLAVVREQFGLPGMSREKVLNFRDKARMKQVLRQAGVPCARHMLATTTAQVWDFAEKNGYPLAVKPPDGAAAQTTFRVNGPAALQQALAVLPPLPAAPVMVEEFITGREFSFDTFSLQGRHLWHSLTQYRPAPLEVMENPWMQWTVLLPREVDAPEYDDIRRVAAQALDALGMETGMSHLEWFRRRDGSLAVSEVGARPPGAQITTLISRAHDVDCVRLWVDLMVFDRFPEASPERKYAAGAAYLRGQGSGRVRAVHGWEQAKAECGHLFTDVRLPHIGQDKGQTYEGEGFVILRHPETEMVAQALSRLVSLVNVELG